MSDVEYSGGSAKQLTGALRRRRLPLLASAVGVFVVAVAIAALWPSTYSSSGTILIEQQELPTDLVRSAVSSYAAQRIQVISQRVMTTENLLRIIEKYNLYAKQRQRKSREEVISQMRRDGSLQMISADVIDPRDGRATKATIAFSIGYSSPSPELAAKVANELVSLYLQQNLETRQQSSRDAAAFLSGESARLSGEIAALDARLAQFKEQHANELPDLGALNQQMNSRTDDEIRDADLQLQALEQQLVFLDAQLAQINPTAQIYTSTGERVMSPADRLKYLRTEYARVSALYSSDHPDVQRLKREIEGLEASGATTSSGVAADYRRQLEDAETRLASARERYAPDHPDVVRLSRLVDSLRTRQSDSSAAAAAAATPAPAGRSASKSAPPDDSDNPAFIQIRAQREATLGQRAALHIKRSQLLRKRDDYEGRLAKAPAVERDYMSIVRELTSAQNQYQQVRQKSMEAQISANLETERKGERFTLIEPPLEPQEPTSPNRPVIVLFGLILAIGIGFTVAVLLESMDGSVRSRDELVELVSTAPLAIIPRMATRDVEASGRQVRRKRLLAGAATGAVVVAVFLVHVLYKPLDVLWAVALRKLGIEV
jgi:succinoglycan biosynthesis transport protein ExoP